MKRFQMFHDFSQDSKFVLGTPWHVFVTANKWLKSFHNNSNNTVFVYFVASMRGAEAVDLGADDFCGFFLDSSSVFSSFFFLFSILIK